MSIIRKSILVLIFLLTLISTIIYFGMKLERQKQLEIGSYMIEKVETYKKVHNKLPVTVEDMGLKKSTFDLPTYEKLNDSSYKLLFILPSHERVEYSSESKTWNKRRIH